MNLEIDRSENLAYIHVVDRSEEELKGIVDRSVFVKDNEDIDMNIVIDFDKDGGIVGFELLNARTQLGKAWDEAIDPLS